MSNLVSLQQLRARVASDLSDDDLLDILDDEEAELIGRYGPHADGVISVTETVMARGASVYVPRRIVSVTSVAEDGTATDAAAYRVWPDQGRLERRSGCWTDPVVITYVPAADQRLRRRALIELVRLAVERQAMKSASIGGEYSFSAPEDWERERDRICARLTLPEV